MRKRELVKQSKFLKIKSKIVSNLFNEKYGLKYQLGEFKNTTGTERVNTNCDEAVIQIVTGIKNRHELLSLAIAIKNGNST